MVTHRITSRAISMSTKPQEDLHNPIVRAFSCFWVPLPNTKYYSPRAYPDLALKPVIEGLLTHAELRVKVDPWARYFLLIGRAMEQIAEEKKAVLRDLDEPGLRATLSSAVRQAPSHNLAVQQIYHHLLEHHDDSSISPFSGSPSYSRALLAAHLQKIGWRAAKQSYSRITGDASLQRLFSIEDFFQITGEEASKPISFLKPFQLSRNVEIKTYAEKKFSGAITDKIRAKDREVITRRQSPDGVLKTVSEKKLKEALARQGRSEEYSTRICFIWKAYKDIYPRRKDDRGKLQPPTSEELMLMCDRANQFRERERERLTQQKNKSSQSRKASKHSPEEHRTLEATVECLSAAVDLDEVNRSLETVVKAIREYSHLEFVDSEKIEEMSVYQPWDSLTEDKGWSAEDVFLQAFSTLDTTAQNILKLYFGLGINQSDIVSILKQAIQVSEQWEVSRKIKNYQKSLLIAFVQTSQKWQASSEAPKITNQTVSQLKDLLDLCLNNLCQKSFDTPLKGWLNSLDACDRSTLYQHYSQSTGSPASQPENASGDEVHLRCQEKLMEEGCQCLKEWITAEFHVDLERCSSLEKKLETFIENWLDERLHLLL